MKKIFYLLTLLLCVASGAWADEVTIFSADVIATSAQEFQNGTTEITSAQATVSGGKIFAVSGQSSAVKLINTTNNAYGFSMTNNNTFFKITLNTALAVGDVITSKGVGGVKSGDNKGIWVTSATSRPGSAPACVGTSATESWVNILSYTVTNDDDLVGKSEIYIYRAAGATTYFDEFVITRTITGSLTPVTLSFQESSYAATLGQSFTAPTLTVDPAAASSEVTYSSSTPAVATVANDGTVTLVAGGTTTITAAISGSETYKDASASYTLTVTDPNVKSVTAAWAFNTGAAGQNATFSYTPAQDEDYFYTNGTVVLGTNLSYSGTQALTINGTATGEKSTKILISSDTQTEANTISFTIKPRKGVTFTPKSVSFRATRCGTDGGKMTMTWYDANSSSVSLGTAAASKTGAGITDPARDNNATQNWTDYSYDLSAKGAVPTTGECGLKIILYSTSGKSYALGNIVIEGEFSGTPESETMYTVTTSVTPDGAGSITQSPAGESIAEGTAVSFSATANTGYAFLNKWTVNGNEVDGATYSIASLAENTSVVAQFKQLFTIDYDKTAEGIQEFTCPEVLKTEYADVNDKFTAPSNLYLTKAGYTFTGWKDGDGNDYVPGTEYTLTKSITLTPQFVENAVSLATRRLDAVTVTWNFGSNFVKLNSEGNTMYYVKQATIDGKKLDVAMFCDQTSGKLNNTNRNDEWAQANNGTKFTIPAMSGMTIVAKGYNNFSSTTFAGSTGYESAKTVTYTYIGTDATIDIVIGDDISYLSSIAVTYPKTHTYVDVTEVGYRTFASKSALDFTTGVEGLTAYRATVDNKKVSFIPIDGPVPAEEGMLIKAEEGRYYIPLATGTPAEIENEFIGVTSKTTVEGAGIFVLMNINDVVGFYKTTAESFEVGANTAYLPANVVSSARSFISIDGDETTGIAEVEGIVVEQQQVYDLQGRRVSESVIRNSELKHGLYIVNGRKVMVK